VITQCPSCQTRFRVHAAQLAVRAGQVRCGKCSRIFDALDFLIEETGLSYRPAQAHEPAARSAVAAAAAAAPEPARAESASPADFGAEMREPSIEAIAAVAEQSTDTAPGASQAAIPVPEQPAGVESGAEPQASTFDFGPIAAADPAKRSRRWPWLLGALLLLLVLLAQAAYQYRSAIIVLFPEAKPYATELCATLGCELPLPRRIELMSIEASDLQADTTNPNVMVLTATLKNRAIFDQQLPMLELTLTNAEDHPVVRRVLAPQDYIGKPPNAQAGFAANTEMVVKVFIEGSQVKATGYRLYLFYP
jgi:predicted Zn finger-like uncharacterized protein